MNVKQLTQRHIIVRNSAATLTSSECDHKYSFYIVLNITYHISTGTAFHFEIAEQLFQQTYLRVMHIVLRDGHFIWYAL